MDWVQRNAKSVATFVIAILLQAVTDVIDGKVELDVFDWQAWLRYLGLSLAAGATVWVTGNKLDLGQILAGTKKLDVPEQAEVAKEVLTKLPDPVSDSVVSGYPDWVSG